MTLTDSLYLVGREFVNILKDIQDGLGIVDVFDGDQQYLPNYPAACVETGSKARELTATGQRTDNVFTVYIMLYYSLIADNQTVRSKAIELAEKLEHAIHMSYETLNGLVVHGNFIEIVPGYTQRQNGLTHVVRLTWAGISKTRLQDVTTGP